MERSLIWRKELRAVLKSVPRVDPNPEWTDTYEKMGALFDDLHETNQQFYDRLDKLPLTSA